MLPRPRVLPELVPALLERLRAGPSSARWPALQALLAAGDEAVVEAVLVLADLELGDLADAANLRAAVRCVYGARCLPGTQPLDGISAATVPAERRRLALAGSFYLQAARGRGHPRSRVGSGLVRPRVAAASPAVRGHGAHPRVHGAGSSEPGARARARGAAAAREGEDRGVAAAVVQPRRAGIRPGGTGGTDPTRSPCGAGGTLAVPRRDRPGRDGRGAVTVAWVGERAVAGARSPPRTVAIRAGRDPARTRRGRCERLHGELPATLARRRRRGRGADRATARHRRAARDARALAAVPGRGQQRHGAEGREVARPRPCPPPC